MGGKEQKRLAKARTLHHVEAQVIEISNCIAHNGTDTIEGIVRGRGQDVSWGRG